MRVFKAIIAAFVLLVMAVHPVLAAMVLCRCAEQKQAACPSMAAPRASPAEHACCGTKRVSKPLAPHESPQCRSPQYRTGCCCIQAPAAIPASREKTAELKLDHHPLGLVAWLSPALPTGLPSDHLEPPSSFSPTGPPLLALYCIWLK